MLLHLHKYDTIRLLFRLREPCSPRKNLNNWTVCYVVGFSSLSKVKKILCYCCSLFFAPFPEKGVLDYIAHHPSIQVFPVELPVNTGF